MNMDEVIAEYGAMVYRLARARTPCAQDAEDVFQEVFCRLARRNPRLDGAEHLKAWLIRATLNCAVSLMRSSWRRHNVLTEAPEARTESKEDYGTLHAALAALPEKYRSAVILFYFEQMKVDEIASTLRRRPGTVRMQLTRGRALLKEILEKGGSEG